MILLVNQILAGDGLVVVPFSGLTRMIQTIKECQLGGMYRMGFCFFSFSWHISGVTGMRTRPMSGTMDGLGRDMFFLMICTHRSVQGVGVFKSAMLWRGLMGNKDQRVSSATNHILIQHNLARSHMPDTMGLWRRRLCCWSTALQGKLLWGYGHCVWDEAYVISLSTTLLQYCIIADYDMPDDYVPVNITLAMAFKDTVGACTTISAPDNTRYGEKSINKS